MLTIEALMQMKPEEVERIGARSITNIKQVLPDFSENNELRALLVEAHRLKLLLQWNMANWDGQRLNSEIRQHLAKTSDPGKSAVLLEILAILPSCRDCRGKHIYCRDDQVYYLINDGVKKKLFSLPKEAIDTQVVGARR